MMLVNKVLSSFFVVLLLLAAQANAQNLLSCKSMNWQSTLEAKDRSYFFDTQNLTQLREAVKVAFGAVSGFQQDRAKEIREQYQSMVRDANNRRAFINSYALAQRDLRVSMAIGFRPFLSEEYLNSDFRYFLNTEMDMTYFRALPNKQVQPLSSSEIERAIGIMRDFFTLEMNLFESLLARQNVGREQNPLRPNLHPLVRLQIDLRNAKNIGEKLLNPNPTLQAYMIERLREFRSQQRELSLMAMLHLPPLAYTVVRRSATLQNYQQAVVQVIQNGDDEVQRLQTSLNMWLSDPEFARLTSQVQSRTLSHKKVTIANAFLKLESLFDYIPAVEEATLQNSNSCEVVERALAIHFKNLSNRQIGNMVLMAAALAVAPMITGPLLMTTAVVGGTAFSVYSIQQETNTYQNLVRSTLTEVSEQDVDPQIYEDLKAIEANIVTQQIFLPTLLPAMGFGLKSWGSMVRLKSLL